ncbi:MAG TPA: SCP2 sterol-binding domain-containing protein [Candidatus Lokiarchaeia archaeon]|nr:SCP2 sterol-binding domain-containing protein [Candidatus Lokiarchaeia archaeon]
MSDEEPEEAAPEAEEEAPAEEAASEEEGSVGPIDGQMKSMAEQFKADQAKGWSKTLMITVTGEGSWQFLIHDGKCNVKAGELPNANLKVTVDAKTWASMMDGKTSGTKAFMSGKLKVKGPMGDLVKMGKVFPGLV